jgi:hypothetical protein
MHTIDFLKRIHTYAGPDDPRGGDFVRFCTRGIGESFPGSVYWLTRAELHGLADEGLEALGFPTEGKDVYFTPHAFVRRDLRVTKDDAVELGDVCWLELDDPDIGPAQFSPKPSLAVATSKGRYHLYWLLAEPTSLKDIESVNHRLVYGHGLKYDKSGWGITKWLRVPGSYNYKRDAPFAVEVVDL